MRPASLARARGWLAPLFSPSPHLCSFASRALSSSPSAAQAEAASAGPPSPTPLPHAEGGASSATESALPPNPYASSVRACAVGGCVRL